MPRLFFPFVLACLWCSCSSPEAGSQKTGGSGTGATTSTATGETGGGSATGGSDVTGGSGGSSAGEGGSGGAGISPDGGPPIVDDPSPRNKFNFNIGWKFIKQDVVGAEAPAFNDATWVDVSTPHTFNDIDTYSHTGPSKNLVPQALHRAGRLRRPKGIHRIRGGAAKG